MTQDHDTPRTDAAEMPLDRVDAIASRPACVVHADFARELERELIELQQQKRNCIEILDDDAKEIAELKAEVERLRSQLKRAVEIAEEFWNNQKQAVTVYHEKLADELAALKKEIK
jgi:HAMP domain-containing protein